MREIKFRGFYVCEDEDEQIFIGGDLVKGAWVYGYVWKNGRGQYFITEENTLTMYAVIPETVGQYTGLKDTEEVKIYEGDIVKWCGSFKETDGTIKNCESIYTVRWVDGAFYQVDELYTPEYEILSDVISVLDDDETYEVIGNIYDNPELLESEKNGTNS